PSVPAVQWPGFRYNHSPHKYLNRYFLATKVYQDRPRLANARCHSIQGVSPKALGNIPRAP
ncbi:hypothetical protein, partial [Moorena sp. SIO4E2]|uniref:hypothetical protein n=1 Tax=Moorena sp. SIO4E2 TaxID=2607826 RepID=UPI00257CCAAC